MNQVLSREEVAALLQGVAEAESNRQKPGQTKKLKAMDDSYKTGTNQRVQQSYLLNPPR